MLFSRVNGKCQLIIGLCFLFVMLTGCDNDSQEKNYRQVQVENICKGIILSPEFSPQTKDIAEKTLKNWHNDIIDAMPVMLHAGYAEHKNKHLLMLDMSDEDFNIAGICIHEKRFKGNDIVTEDYPLFKFKNIGHCQIVQFTEREEGDRKNDNEWKEYIANKSVDTPRPDIFISIPKEKEIEVKIYIYDTDGNKSNSVLLKPYIKIPYPYLDEKGFLKENYKN